MVTDQDADEPGRIDLIQVLRAVAAIAVVFGHSISRLVRSDAIGAKSSLIMRAGDLQSTGQAGVDLFFVISGFIMLYVHYDHFQRPRSPQRFMLKRIIRIVPIYWILTTLGIFLLVVAPSLFTYHTHADFMWFLTSYLFIPWQPELGPASPVLGVGWTLNYEMYFYLIFAIALIFPRARAVVAITIMFALSVAIGMVLHPQAPWPMLLTNWLLLEFLCGLLIAYALRRAHLRPNRILCFGAIALGLFVIALTSMRTPDDGWQRFVLWGLPAALILFGAAALRVRRANATLLMLGDASYSIYLFQVFALPGIAVLFRLLRLQAFLPFDLLVILLTVLATAAGVLCWYALERPIGKALRGRFVLPQAALASA